MEKKTGPFRRFPRFKVQLLVRFRQPGTFAWNTGELLNLSKGGVCLYARGDELGLVKGIGIELEALTEDAKGTKHVRKFHAVVSWKRGSRYGLEFVTKPAPPKPKTKSSRSSKKF